MSFCLAVLLCSPASPAAQSIRGRLVDQETGHAIAGGIVSLLNAADHVVQSVLSADSGLFLLTAPLPGRFRLSAERIGYQNTTSSPVDLRLGEVIEIQFHL